MLPQEDLGRFELETVALWYRSLRDHPPTKDDVSPEDPEMPMLEWPKRMLMMCDWGCNIYSCVDCSRPELPVLRNDNNVSWSTFPIEDPSLQAWLRRAVDGENLFSLNWEAAPKVIFPAWPRPQRDTS